MSAPSYRGESQPALTGGRLAGLAWSEAPPEYRGQQTTSPSPQEAGGLLAGLQRLLGVVDAPEAPAYRREPAPVITRESPRARRVTKNERPPKPPKAQTPQKPQKAQTTE